MHHVSCILFFSSYFSWLNERGERGWNFKRVINNRLGLTRASDCLPKALKESFDDADENDYVPDLEAMLNSYYHVRGWDLTSGIPSKEKLQDLGLIEAINDLYQQ